MVTLTKSLSGQKDFVEHDFKKQHNLRKTTFQKSKPFKTRTYTHSKQNHFLCKTDILKFSYPNCSWARRNSQTRKY